MKNFKIEIFHDQSSNKSYYYDFAEEQLFQRKINLTNSSNTNLLNFSAVGSATVGIFAVIINRWYLTVATTLSNVLLTLVTFILLILFSQYVKREINKQNKFTSDVEFELTPQLDIKNVIEKSENLIKFWTITIVILLIAIVVGVPVFYRFNYLIGLIMLAFGIEGIFLVLRYLKLGRRRLAIKQLKMKGNN